MKNNLEVPIYCKLNLTIEEAAVYSNIGENKLREITDDPRCPFVIYKGNRSKLIKRKEFEKWNSEITSL